MAATYDAITEFRLNKQAKDIVLFIYDLPVNNLDTKYKENKKLVGKLRNNNNNAIITFNENLVGAFNKIDNWCGAKVNTSDEKAQRTIDISNERERKLLECLIKQDIICHADRTLYKNVCCNFLKSKRPVWSNKETDIY